jgi:PKD repeat protein
MKTIFAFCTSFLLLFEITSSQAQSVYYEPVLRNEFAVAYQQNPSVPSGVLEAVAFTNTRMSHLTDNDAESCTGMSKHYTMFGLVEQSDWFRANLVSISTLSGITTAQIKNDRQNSIKAFASAYSALATANNQERNSSATSIYSVLTALSEFPLPLATEDATMRNQKQYVLDVWMYSIFSFLNDERYAGLYGFQLHNINLREFFGDENFALLSSPGVSISATTINSEQYKYRYNAGVERNAANAQLLSPDYGPALWNPAGSCNYSSRNNVAVSAVTIHTVQGSYAGCISWFQNCNAGVSAHYVLRSSDGQITQMVLESNKAWHVGSENPYTIGLEHEGYVNNAAWYTTAMYQSSAALVKDICNDYSINPKRTGFWPWLATTYYNQSGIPGACSRVKGHQHYPNQTHTDPGANWNWNYYYQLVNSPAPTATVYTTSSGTFYDSGGNTGNYTNDERRIWTISPANAASLTVSFTSFNVENTWDYLYVYDGNSINAPLIGYYTGTQNPGTITSSGSSLTFEFRSDCATVGAGWNASWTSSTPIALPNAAFTASTTTVCAGAPVNFTDNSTNSPTSWSWTFPGGTPASATTQNATGVVWNTAGTYTVTHTATNASGTGTQTLIITVNPAPSVATTASNTTICAGNSTTLTASGASTYSWMPGNLTGTSATVSPTTTTTYTVTGISAAGCTNTATRTITVNALPTVTTTASNPTICAGNAATLTATGASTYNWTPGNLTGASVTVSPATTTTYTVTGTAGNSCTNTSVLTVTVNPSPTVTITASNTSVCVGNSTTLTASGAASYTWMPGNLTDSSASVNPSVTTTYTVTGTDANGCANTDTATVNVNALPSVTATASSASICAGSTVILTASGASSYVWQPGNATGSSIVEQPIANTTYSVIGTDANGCDNLGTVTVNVNNGPVVTASGNATICPGEQTTLTASGAVSYVWQPGGQTTATITVSPVTTTTYTVTGTDSNGCTSTTTITVSVGNNPATPSVTVNGNMLTSTVTGASYQWFLNGVPIVGEVNQSTTALTPGSYTVEVYDANGCTSGQSAPVVITVVEAAASTTQLAVYPNPTNGMMMLTLGQLKDPKYVLEVHNALGQIVYREQLSVSGPSMQKELNLGIYGTGVYEIRIVGENSSTHVRAVVQ